MPWPVLITAIGLLLVFEGILPFLSPHIWRRALQQIFLQSDRTLHIMGLVSMVIGAFIIFLARQLYT